MSIIESPFDSAAGAAFAFADPRPALSLVRAQVAIIHGRDDDVIPWLEADKLFRALPPGHRARLYITGLYGHTGPGRPALLGILNEALTLLRVLKVLAGAPSGRI